MTFEKASTAPERVAAPEHRKESRYEDGLEGKLINIEALSFRDHIDGTRRQSAVYVTHQTYPEALLGFVRHEGLLEDPRSIDSQEGNQFVQTEIFTHPLIAKTRSGFDFADILERNFQHLNAIQADPAKNQRRRITEEGNEQNVVHTDHLVILRDQYPAFFQKIKEKMKQLSEEFPDIFLFKDYGDDFLWQRQTVAEFIVPEHRRKASQRTAEIMEELGDAYEKGVRHHLTKQQLDEVQWPRPIEDERRYVAKLEEEFHQKYGHEERTKEVAAFFARIAMLFAKGSASQPTYYDEEFPGISLLIELDDSLIDIAQAQKGTFTSKSVAVDSQGSFMISPEFENKNHERILPLKYVKAIILQNQSPDICRAAIVKATRAFRDDPASCIPIYDGFGNMVWPKRISHEQIVQKLAP